MNKYFLLICCIIFFIHGCHVSKNVDDSLINQQKNNIILLDLHSSIENIVSKILQSNNMFNDKNTLFFINIPENKTNIFIDTKSLINFIKKTFNQKNNKIDFLKEQIIAKNKIKLGISNINNQLDTGAALVLSRENNVNYYLHSSILSEQNSCILKMELILVKTGEIVFTSMKQFYCQK